MTENSTSKQPINPAANTQRKPNETGSISVEGFVKIFDPNTKQVLVQKRGD